MKTLEKVETFSQARPDGEGEPEMRDGHSMTPKQEQARSELTCTDLSSIEQSAEGCISLLNDADENAFAFAAQGTGFSGDLTRTRTIEEDEDFSKVANLMERSITASQALSKYNMAETDLLYIGRPAIQCTLNRLYSKKELVAVKTYKAAVEAQRASFKEAQQAEEAQEKANACARREEEQMRLRQECGLKLDLWKQKYKHRHNLQHSTHSVLPIDVWEKTLKLLAQDIEMEVLEDLL